MSTTTCPRCRKTGCVPTDAPAGSPAKEKALADRVRRGVCLHHPQDNPDADPGVRPHVGRVPGVTRCGEKWRACVHPPGAPRLHLGLFATEEEAQAAVREARDALGLEKKVHGREPVRLHIRLRLFIRTSGLTRKQILQRMRQLASKPITKNCLSQVLAGKRSPSVGTLCALAAVLTDGSLDRLVGVCA